MNPQTRITLAMKLPLLLTLAVLAPNAHALDAACEPYLKAAEKGTQQPARHSVSDFGEGTRIEGIVVDDVLYANMGGQWRKVKKNFWADERGVHAEIRSGKIKMYDCKKLGRETVDGIATTVYSYRIDMPGMPPDKGEPAKAYIGDDGLVYAQQGGGAKIRYRYTGVTVPKL